MVSTATSNIDPTQSFIDYVNTVKPYHTKILEVGVEYLWNDDVNVTILDNADFVIDFLTIDTATSYIHGWGSTWDPPSQFQKTVFRIADFVGGTPGSITVEGDHTSDMVIGDRFVTWYDTDFFPSSTVYTITGVTLVSGNTTFLVAESVIGPALNPWYGLVIKAIPLINYDKTTNSIIVPGDYTQLVVDGTVVYTPTLSFVVTGLMPGTGPMDRCYFEIAGDHTALFPDGTRFTLSGSSLNGGQYNVAPGGALYLSTIDATRIYVRQQFTSSIVDGTILSASMQIVQHSTPDYQLVELGADFFVVNGDRVDDFPDSGPAYHFVSDNGNNSTFLTTRTGSQHYISSDPALYLVDPFYGVGAGQVPRTNVTIISSDSVIPDSSYLGGYVQLANAQTQIYVKSEVDTLPATASSQFVFCLPNGEGWSSPEYSALLTSSPLHTDSYIHERFTIEIS